MIFLIGIGKALKAQNRDIYFKTIPLLEKNVPEWVQLMYSPDPNILEVDQKREKYYQINVFKKNIHTQNYKHWRQIIEPYINDQGFIRPPSQREENDDYQKIKNKKAQQNIGRSPSTGWMNIGPIETYKVGTLTPITKQSNVYCLDQSASQPNILYAGTESGGVFKTTNRGQNWELVSKNEVFSNGMSAIQIHPTNPNIVLVCGNRRIYRSIDGGITWNEVHYFNATGFELKFNPNNPLIIYCAHSSGLLRSIDGGTGWTTVFNEKTWDIDFHPNNPDTIYILKDNAASKRAEVFRSDNGGASWNLKATGWYNPISLVNARVGGGKIAISPLTPNIIYTCLIGDSKQGDNGWIGVYRSDDKGENWINPSGQDGGPYSSINGTSPWNVAAYSSGYHQGFYNFDLEASSIVPGTIWIGTIRLSESQDSGRTFQSIGAANSTRLSDVHADIQDIEVNGNEVWVANDGGIEYSQNHLQTHIARNTGITASNFWGFNSGWNEDVLFGGKYHNGNSAYYQTYGIGNYHIIGGVEEATGYVNPIQNRKVYYRTHYSSPNTSVRLIPDILGGNAISFPSLPLRANESYSESYKSGQYFDPRYADHIFIGRDSIIWKSTDGGANFSRLYSFPAGLVLEIAISKNNPDYIYAVFQSGPSYWNQCVIYKTIDGGVTWSQTTLPPTNNRFRLEITLNPINENEIWVSCNRGANGQKVYQSLDGGSTWINKTTSLLDNENLRDIYYQGGSNSLVYVATNNGVFYWDNTINDWVNYSNNLPLVVNPLKIKPFYRDAKLRLATSGRGIFSNCLADTSFLPVASPITYTDTVRCSRDTIQLECLSILRHRGASWQWTITPTPRYISSTTQRNPKVVFGANGSYDITLQVIDENGNTSSKTIPKMITVASVCEPDSIPSQALHLANNGDRVAISTDQLKGLTHFTFSAWIKPDSAQQAYAGIISNGNWCAHCSSGTVGLVMDYWASRLWFRLPGTNKSWAGNSGLIVPIGEWSYVAMVVEPTQVTLYLNDQKYVSTGESFNPIDISQLYIGYGHYSKSFKGTIDEVSIWKKALTEEEIKSYRHLTKHQLVGDPNLYAYFQFNNLVGNGVIDNGGTSGLANFHGTPTLVKSTAPIGHGTCQHLNITTGGSYNFNQVGLQIDFPATGIIPTGDLYVTRLHLYPDSLPNNSPLLDDYWIINNYSTNKNFTKLNNMRFTLRNNNISNNVFSNPSQVKLYKRRDNAHLNNWILNCTSHNAISSTTSYFDFGASCNMTSFSQFFITSNILLPVKILSFEAHLQNDKSTLVNWRVAQEIDVESYIIQYSRDGINFINIGEKKPLAQQTYSFIHDELIAGYGYYRLMIIDKDKSTDYSQIVSIWIPEDNSNLINISPNPTHVNRLISVSLGKFSLGRLQIFKSSGKLVKDVFLTQNRTSLELLELTSGIYFYTIETEGQIHNGKLILQ